MNATERIGDPIPLRTFYVTFGMMYATEPHPYWPGAHPEGYLEVVAPDEEAARLLVRACIGLKWGHMYDRRPEWARRGALALVTSDGRVWQTEGVEPPTLRFDPSSPEYYGRDADEVVCARIEGVLAENSDTDAIERLGYEVEYVHHGCFAPGVQLFEKITQTDWSVLAGELDWSSPYPCPVCEESIT